MVRVKRGTSAHKRRKHVLQYAKGFRWGRKSKYKLAKDAMYHAWEYAFRDRRAKKREFRKLWQTQIGIASRNVNLPYNKLISGLKVKKIDVDRKILAELARNHPAIFEKITEAIK